VITDVPGVSLGRSGGVTVVLVPSGAVAGMDTRGAPLGTREIDLLDPSTLVQQVQAVCVPTGGTRGLAAVDGVVRWLESEFRGFPVGPEPHEVVPLVPAAVVFSGAVPTAEDGFAACTSLVHDGVSAAVGDHTIGAIAFVDEVAVGVVAVDALLTRAQCQRVAMSAHDGLVRAGHRVPATVFALATGSTEPSSVDALCTAAAEVFERALAGTRTPCPD
jgi:L-aminopeptidase/D-esterase-like protein